MGIKMHLNDGESFVHGRSPQKAAELLDKLAKSGKEGTVRTTTHGYIVPSHLVGDEAEAKSEDREVKEQEKAEEDLFDPTVHTIAEVEEYLSTADDAERERVLTAEREGKKTRKTLVADTEGDK